MTGMQRLLEVMAQLRDPDTGCPWDRKQTLQSIVPHTLEEAYEVADAIASGDINDIREELGDLLFQVVFYAQITKEQGEFDFNDVAATMADKLIFRHPHVFGDSLVDSDAQLSANWEAAKAAERAAKGRSEDVSLLANIPAGMAPLLRALKMQKRCATVGFDWPDVQPVADKVQEELSEVMEVADLSPDNAAAVEEEVGDLLFAVVNLSRHLKVNPEVALHKASNKFEQRFRAVEASFSNDLDVLKSASLKEMEAAWQRVKKIR